MDPSRLAVMGASRGGELALLLGATFPMLRAVVAYAPSHVVWSEIAFGFRRRRSSWSHKGRPLPFVDMQLPMGSAMAARVLDSNPDAVIPVERINGAVLAVSGMEDTLWPSSFMADRVMDRLARPPASVSLRASQVPGGGAWDHTALRHHRGADSWRHRGWRRPSERALLGARSLLPAREPRTVTAGVRAP